VASTSEETPRTEHTRCAGRHLLCWSAVHASACERGRWVARSCAWPTTALHYRRVVVAGKPSPSLSDAPNNLGHARDAVGRARRSRAQRATDARRCRRAKPAAPPNWFGPGAVVCLAGRCRTGKEGKCGKSSACTCVQSRINTT
jgi:hypothetical protein